MSEPFNYLRITNLTVLTYLFLVLFLQFEGAIQYGHGLGDFFYSIYAGAAFCIQLILTAVFERKNLQAKAFLITTVVFLAIALHLTWRFTLGRGPENSWNGYIFNF